MELDARRTGDRTTVRETPDAERLAALTEDEHLWLAQLLDRLPDSLELEPTTALVYGVPKLARGLGLDDAAHRPDQGRPEGVLQAALQPAGRRRPRPAPADALRRPRRRPRAVAADPAARLAQARGAIDAGEQRVVGRRARVAQERRAAVPLVGLADRLRGPGRAGPGSARKPRLGSCSHGTGPWPFQPLRRSRSRRAVVADPGVGVDGDGSPSAARGRPPGRPRRPARPGAGVRRRPGAVPASRSACAGSSGRWVGGGPAIRSWWVTECIVLVRVLA